MSSEHVGGTTWAFDPLWVDESIHDAVVRCRNCKAFLENATPHDYEHPHFCTTHGTDLATPDGFCAWGEPREAS